MIETIWDLTLQQLPKLANNQNLTTKPLQIHNGTNASLRTKRPNIFFKSFSSPIQLLTKCWQPTGSQNFELWKGLGMNQSRNSQIRGRGRCHPLPGNWVQIRIREVGVWKNIYCNCIAGAGEHFSFPRTDLNYFLNGSWDQWTLNNNEKMRKDGNVKIKILLQHIRWEFPSSATLFLLTGVCRNSIINKLKQIILIMPSFFSSIMIFTSEYNKRFLYSWTWVLSFWIKLFSFGILILFYNGMIEEIWFSIQQFCFKQLFSRCIYSAHWEIHVYARYRTLVQGLNVQENWYQAIQIRKQ